MATRKKADSEKIIVGSRVIINPKSSYCSQHSGVGTVTQDDGDDESDYDSYSSYEEHAHRFEVKFETGGDWYRQEDLLIDDGKPILIGLDSESGNVTHYEDKLKSLAERLKMRLIYLNSPFRTDTEYSDLTLHVCPDIMFEFRWRSMLSTFYLEVANKMGRKFDNYNYLSFRDTTPFEYTTYKTILDGVEYPFMYYIPSRNVVMTSLPLKLDLYVDDDGNDYFEWYMDEIEKGITFLKAKTEKKNAKQIFIDSIMLKEYNQAGSDNEEKLKLKHEISKTRKNYLDNLKKMSTITRKTKKTKLTSRATLKHIAEEIEKIKELPFVKSVRFGDMISVKMKKATLEWGGVPFDLGEFDLRFNGENILVLSDNQVGSYTHPHISQTSICWGNARKIPYKLLTDLELKKFVSFMWAFLQQYYEPDCYQQPIYFVYAHIMGDNAQVNVSHDFITKVVRVAKKDGIEKAREYAKAELKRINPEPQRALADIPQSESTVETHTTATVETFRPRFFTSDEIGNPVGDSPENLFIDEANDGS